MSKVKVVIGIDASRIRSGGAINHIIGILKSYDPEIHNIEKIHLWSYEKLLNLLPEYPWLEKHSHSFLRRNLLFQLFWQRFLLKPEATRLGCDLMFDSDAGSISVFKPNVTMSQDLLNFEKDSLKGYAFGFGRLRLWILYYIQKASFQKANGVIFLTDYSRRIIENHTGKLSDFHVVAHGVDSSFRKIYNINRQRLEGVVRCVYVSPVLEYKNHIKVIEAISLLVKKGFNIVLDIIGDYSSSFGRKVVNTVKNQGLTPYINFLGNMPHSQLAEAQSSADIAIFASSVENLPITLIEHMASGMPIACAERGPMPNVLQDGGVYFDPEEQISIANAIEKLVLDDKLRIGIAKRGRELSEQYSWQRCSDETFTFLTDIVERVDNKIAKHATIPNL